MVTGGVSVDCFVACLSHKLPVLLLFRTTEFLVVCISVGSEIRAGGAIDFR